MIKQIIFVVLITFSGISASHETLRLTNGEWPPYTSEHLYKQGFVSHLVKEVFATVDVNVEYGFFPWKRSFLYAKGVEGKLGANWHGSIAWLYIEDRTQNFIYTDPVIRDEEVLFFRKDSRFSWETVEDLKGKIVGVTSYSMYPGLEDAAQKNIIELERAGDEERLFKRLLKRRVDAIPQVKFVANYLLEKNFSKQEREQITFSPKPIHQRNYHVILDKNSNKSQRLANMFDQAFAKFKTTDKYRNMLKDLKSGKYHELKTD